MHLFEQYYILNNHYETHQRKSAGYKPDLNSVVFNKLFFHRSIASDALKWQPIFEQELGGM